MKENTFATKEVEFAVEERKFVVTFLSHCKKQTRDYDYDDGWRGTQL